MSNETAITAKQIELVKQTWGKVVPIADTASKLFYDRLFETSPQLAPMFRGVDLASQRQKLVKAINMVVMSLERIDTLLPTIRELGKRHVAYGVEETHYAEVGAALLWTLETGLGDAWSDEAEAAWTRAYRLLSGVMMEGAKQGVRNAA
jgi:hemoglobin-like flavoprotein